MDIEKLKQILIENKIFVSDKTKNFICVCPYCSDHPNPRKKGHLYVSKNSDMPVAHCWFCNGGWPIPKLISDLTGNKVLYKEVISDDELNGAQQKSKQYSEKKRTIEYKVTNISNDTFSEKKMYIRKRTGNKMTAEQVPNLILNFTEFFYKNNLDIVGEGKLISNYEMDLLQNKFIGFLGAHNTLLYCRNINDDATFKFKKIPLQTDGLFLLDYWKINCDANSNLVVLAEGNFDILSEYAFDSLGLKDKARMFVGGNTFAYSSLLKSVCYDESLYKVDVVILSDTDKPAHWYRKFLKDNSHIIRGCKIYMNKRGKDFGVFPPVPSQII